MNKYIIYISAWFVISVLTLLLFKFIPKKMKDAEDMQTKNTLYTLLIFIGIPLMLVSVLTPPVFLIGDKNMDLIYELIWGGLCLVFVVYFIIKQMSGKNTDSNKNGDSLNNV